MSPSTAARALQIAEAAFDHPDAAWARRTVRTSDPAWNRAAIIRRYFWWPALAQAEREAAEAASDLPARIFRELADAGAAHFVAQMTADTEKWSRLHSATLARLARAEAAASAHRASMSSFAAE